MNKSSLIAVVIAVVAVAGVGIYYYLKSYPVPVQSSAPMPQTGATQSPTPAVSNVVSIQNFAFSPATLTVKVGDTVTWTNNDSVQHQIKSDNFNSSPLSKGQSYSFTFQTAGTYDYSCAIHPTMKGQIIVEFVVQ